MAKKKIKTNALRLLDRDKIAYEVRMFNYDADHLSAMDVAREVGMDPKDIYKTLVLEDEKKQNLVCCIPAEKEINLKKLARAAGRKKVEMIHMKDLLQTTGYVRGGCSPVGMKKQFPTYFDISVQDKRPIAFSAGKRGCQMIVDSEEFTAYVGAELVDVCD